MNRTRTDQKPSAIGWLDWLPWICLAATSPFFLFPSVKFIWVLCLAPAAWLARGIGRRHFFGGTFLDWPLALLLIQVLATCFVVPDIGHSLPKIAGVLFGMLFYYSSVTLMGSSRLIRGGLFAFAGAGIALTAVSLLDFFWSPEAPFAGVVGFFIRHLPRLPWRLPGAELGVNPNVLAGTLILIIPLCFSSAISGRAKKERLLFAGTLFVFLLALFLTQALASWIALFLSAWLVFFPWKWKKWSLILLASAGIILLALSPSRTLSAGASLKDKYIVGKVQEHVRFWRTGAEAVRDHPLFGVGMNRIRLDPSVGYEYSHVHNQLLQTAAELGIPAAAAYLAVIFGAGWMSLRLWRGSSVPWIRAAARGLGGGQLAFFIFGLGDCIPLGAKVGIFFWLSLALITSLFILEKAALKEAAG